MRRIAPVTTRKRVPVIIMLLVAMSSLVWAEERAAVTPMVLRGIMQEMSRNMQAITDAIAREAWGEVTRISPLIGDHPQPPMTEKLRILAFFSGRAGEFKRHDAETHQAAQALQQAAADRDGEAVIAAYASLQQSCLRCHQVFRNTFIAHFYPAK